MTVITRLLGVVGVGDEKLRGVGRGQQDRDDLIEMLKMCCLNNFREETKRSTLRSTGRFVFCWL